MWRIFSKIRDFLENGLLRSSWKRLFSKDFLSARRAVERFYVFSFLQLFGEFSCPLCWVYLPPLLSFCPFVEFICPLCWVFCPFDEFFAPLVEFVCFSFPSITSTSSSYDIPWVLLSPFWPALEYLEPILFLQLLLHMSASHEEPQVALSSLQFP